MTQDSEQAREQAEAPAARFDTEAEAGRYMRGERDEPVVETETADPYAKLPEHVRAGFRAYIEDHHQPGGFILAALANDLVKSFGRADPTNRERMLDIVEFLYNEAPSGCWGSKEIVAKWLKQRKD